MVFFADRFCGFSFGATKSRYNWQTFMRAMFLRCYKVSLIALAILLSKKKK